VRKAVMISIMVMLLGGAFGNFLRFGQPSATERPDFSMIPYEAGPYIGEERRFSDQSYQVLQADTTCLRRYEDADGKQYWLFVSYFSSQKYGSQMHSPRHCLPGGGWSIDRVESFELSLPDGCSETINRLQIGREGRKQLMFYWFQTRSDAITNEFEVKWDLVTNSLRFRPTDAAFIRLTTPVQGGDIAAATARAEAFLRTFHGDIMRALPLSK